MAPTSTLLAAVGVLAEMASGFYVGDLPGAVAGPGFISVPVSTTKNNLGLRKRADVKGTANLEIPNLQSSGYTIKISVGTPPQDVIISVDTGSSELWVNPDCSASSLAGTTTGANGTNVTTVDNPRTDPNQCKKYGHYERSKSSTAKDTKLSDKDLKYTNNTTVKIGYVSDTIAIGGLTISDQVFGVAKTSNKTGIGRMGFGPYHDGFNYTKPYPLILGSMAKQGVINSAVFSLNLRDFDNDTGSLIFGGIDTKQYTGELTKIPFEKFLVKTEGADLHRAGYYLTVKSMDLTRPDNTTKSYPLGSSGFQATLDSSTAVNILPASLAASMCTDLKGEEVTRDVCVVDCKLRTQTGGVTFVVSGKTSVRSGEKAIMVSYSNLINEVAQSGSDPNLCFLAATDSWSVSPAAESWHVNPATLGAPFLRSAYAVFDWGNENVHLAQAANCGSNIKAVGSGPDAVPGDNGECEGADDSFAVRGVVNFGVVLGVSFVSGLALL